MWRTEILNKKKKMYDEKQLRWRNKTNEHINKFTQWIKQNES
jgi:hypothetical protein